MSWYALQVYTGRETDTAQRLRGRGIQAIAPERCLIEKKSGELCAVYRVAMPGYVFVRCDMSVALYHHLMGKPGVIRLLGQSGAKFEAIPDTQMGAVIILNEGTANGSPGISHCRRTEAGEIEITDGPLLTLRDSIIKYDLRRQRATVKITIYGEEYEIDMALKLTDDKQS